jgi:hypothetical protein
MEKPVKRSKLLLASGKQEVKDYLVDADKDIQNLVNYMVNFPKVYILASVPSIPSDTIAFCKTTGDGKFYLLCNIGGAQKKVELT